MNRFLLSLILLSCARVGYPPGKPEINNPQMDIEIPSTFKNFPIEIKLKAKDDTRLKDIKIFEGNYKIFQIALDTMAFDTTIVVDTLKNFSDTIAVYSFKFEAEDIYDNLTQKTFDINYKKEENKPIIEVLDTNFSETPYYIKVHLFDDTRLKSFYIFRNDSLFKNFNFSSKDTTIQITLDSLNVRTLKLKLEDIYLNFIELYLKINK